VCGHWSHPKKENGCQNKKAKSSFFRYVVT
jgi:hypothetical protein